MLRVGRGAGFCNHLLLIWVLNVPVPVMLLSFSVADVSLWGLLVRVLVLITSNYSSSLVVCAAICWTRFAPFDLPSMLSSIQ
jgi:hypothetical protein